MTDPERRSRRVHVTINHQRVALPAGPVGVLEIKQEAVAQGAELQVGFALSVREGRRYRELDDEQVVAVGTGDEFLAVSQDDHS